MKKFFKWTAIVLGGLIVLTLLAGLILYPIGMKKITRSYPVIQFVMFPIPATNPDAIARGRHLSVIWGCTRCHGEDLSGKVITNDPVVGTIPIYGSIPASNLTSGKGGVGQTYTETDWVRAVQHGVKPNGQAEIFMNVSTMNNMELGYLITYLEQIPQVDNELPALIEI